MNILDANYLGIESIFNATNYWINMQEVSLEAISYDIWDTKKWEYVLVENRRVTDAPLPEIVPHPGMCCCDSCWTLG